MGHQKALVPSRRYTMEFKVEAVRLAESVGCSEASRRVGIPELSLFNWMKLKRANKLADAGGSVSATPRSAKELEVEVDRLRGELASARLDNDLLKKAAAYFARESRCSTPGLTLTATCKPLRGFAV